jgi:hypothetical protein
MEVGVSQFKYQCNCSIYLIVNMTLTNVNNCKAFLTLQLVSLHKDVMSCVINLVYIEERGSDEAKARVTTFEEAMHKIQEATGVTDVQEVVHRFLVQGETQENLKRLQQENTELLARLREVRLHTYGCYKYLFYIMMQEHARVTKEFETLKYSGEARNTSNQRMLAEFEQHLSESQQKLNAAKENEGRSSKLLVDVKAGVDHLSDKLEKLKAVCVPD